MQRLSYQTETVLFDKITRNIGIVQRQSPNTIKTATKWHRYPQHITKRPSNGKKEQVWPSFCRHTSDSQTDAGRHQL